MRASSDAGWKTETYIVWAVRQLFSKFDKMAGYCTCVSFSELFNLHPPVILVCLF